MSMKEMSNKRLREEPPPPPLTTSEAKERAAFIRGEITKVTVNRGMAVPSFCAMI